MKSDGDVMIAHPGDTEVLLSVMDEQAHEIARTQLGLNRLLTDTELRNVSDYVQSATADLIQSALLAGIRGALNISLAAEKTNGMLFSIAETDCNYNAIADESSVSFEQLSADYLLSEELLSECARLAVRASAHSHFPRCRITRIL